MNAKEILDKFKSILLSDVSEEVETPQVEAEVELTEEVEETKEELAQDTPEEDVQAAPAEEAPMEEPEFVTREEMAKEVAQLSAMIEQIMEGLSSEKSKDVPEELSAQEAEQPQEEVELSAEESVVEIKHDPEAFVDKRELNMYAQNRKMSTLDRVLSKISK